MTVLKPESLTCIPHLPPQARNKANARQNEIHSSDYFHNLLGEYLLGEYLFIVLISVGGTYTDFGDWSECSVSCGDGTQTRKRTCNSPFSAEGDADCVGPASETRPCKLRECPGLKYIRYMKYQL